MTWFLRPTQRGLHLSCASRQPTNSYENKLWPAHIAFFKAVCICPQHELFPLSISFHHPYHQSQMAWWSPLVVEPRSIYVGDTNGFQHSVSQTRAQGCQHSRTSPISTLFDLRLLYCRDVTQFEQRFVSCCSTNILIRQFWFFVWLTSLHPPVPHVTAWLRFRGLLACSRDILTCEPSWDKEVLQNMSSFLAHVLKEHTLVVLSGTSHKYINRWEEQLVPRCSVATISHLQAQSWWKTKRVSEAQKKLRMK